MAKKSWGYSPRKKTSSTTVPATVKQDIQSKADELLEKVLIPRHIKPPEPDQRLNYITKLYTKWYRHYFYFCASYNVTGPNAIRPSFETKFARLEYVADDRFNMAYMRYTEQWQEVAYGVPLAKALAMIEQDPLFMP